MEVRMEFSRKGGSIRTFLLCCLPPRRRPLKKNFGGRNSNQIEVPGQLGRRPLAPFGSKRILEVEKHCILAQKEFWRLKSIAFCSKKNFGGRKALHFGSKRILAAEKHCILLQKEFWRPKLKSDRSTRPAWPAPLGAFCSKKNFDGRNLQAQTT